ncbi:MAG: tRNA 2-thiocytidine biosynthesis protein TtcA [Clostridia bacterium]|nr:tRNA 2-thiocytidine biosynthesis protein TtcA [Clostridia bacterium]
MRELSKSVLIERSIIKKFRKQLWAPFVEAIKRYKLIQENDRIAVCISGGKDSMLLAKLMQQLKCHSEVPFELIFLAMDPGYNEANRQKIEYNASLMEIPVQFFDSEIFDIANTVTKSPCYLCARMRRGHLYANAKELGCNKIALGHHMSDVIETTLMGMMYGSQIQGMLPRLKSTNFEGMELIRPMYCILEEDIISWRDYNELSFLQCACRFTENIDKSGDGIGESKRQEIKALIKELKKVNPDVEHNLFESIHNVSVDTMVEYKLNGEPHSFLERFDQKTEDVL